MPQDAAIAETVCGSSKHLGCCESQNYFATLVQLCCLAAHLYDIRDSSIVYDLPLYLSEMQQATIHAIIIWLLQVGAANSPGGYRRK